MQLTISGHQLDVSPALRDYASEKFERVARHFDHVITTHVVLHVQKNRHLAEATVSASGATLHATAQAADMYAAIDALVDKLDRQAVKQKEKRHDHHQQGGALKDQVLK